MTDNLQIETDQEKRLVREALKAHADLMWDMGADEELDVTEELLERLE